MPEKVRINVIRHMLRKRPGDPADREMVRQLYGFDEDWIDVVVGVDRWMVAVRQDYVRKLTNF